MYVRLSAIIIYYILKKTQQQSITSQIQCLIQSSICRHTNNKTQDKHINKTFQQKKKKKNILRPIENMKRTSPSITCTYHEHRALSHVPIMNIALYYLHRS